MRSKADYFYGIGENGKPVSGWAPWFEWSDYAGTAFDGSAQFPVPPRYDKLDQYRAAVDDEAGWVESSSFTHGFYAFMEDGVMSPADGAVQPHAYRTVDTVAVADALEELHAAIPWDTLFSP